MFQNWVQRTDQWFYDHTKNYRKITIPLLDENNLQKKENTGLYHGQIIVTAEKPAAINLFISSKHIYPKDKNYNPQCFLVSTSSCEICEQQQIGNILSFIFYIQETKSEDESQKIVLTKDDEYRPVIDFKTLYIGEMSYREYVKK